MFISAAKEIIYLNALEKKLGSKNYIWDLQSSLKASKFAAKNSQKLKNMQDKVRKPIKILLECHAFMVKMKI